MSATTVYRHALAALVVVATIARDARRPAPARRARRA